MFHITVCSVIVLLITILNKIESTIYISFVCSFVLKDPFDQSIFIFLVPLIMPELLF